MVTQAPGGRLLRITGKGLTPEEVRYRANTIVLQGDLAVLEYVN
jgi:hypothetical protein